MKYPHIVFDIDGTITDTETPSLLALQDVCVAQLGRKPELSELRFAFGMPSSMVYQKLGFKDIEKTGEQWRARFGAHSGAVALFPGIEETLCTLKQLGHVLGIITSRSYVEFAHSFTPFGLNELFSLVVCADDTKQHKPDPEPMQLYLSQMNTKCTNVLYVGDTKYDMCCAHDAGCAGALATWGSHDKTQARAEFYPASPLDLIPIAQGLVEPCRD